MRGFAKDAEHCSGCGAEDFDTDDGYTDCCNEPICDGWEGREWLTTDGDTVKGCCITVVEVADPNVTVQCAVSETR